MGKDSAARIELGRSFHQMGTVNEKVCEIDFVPLWDCTEMRQPIRVKNLSVALKCLRLECTQYSTVFQSDHTILNDLTVTT